MAWLPLSIYHNRYVITFDILASYGSVNYQIGRPAIGVSLRWDRSDVAGQVFSPAFGNARRAC